MPQMRFYMANFSSQPKKVQMEQLQVMTTDTNRQQAESTSGYRLKPRSNKNQTSATVNRTVTPSIHLVN